MKIQNLNLGMIAWLRAVVTTDLSTRWDKRATNPNDINNLYIKRDIQFLKWLDFEEKHYHLTDVFDKLKICFMVLGIFTTIWLLTSYLIIKFLG